MIDNNKPDSIFINTFLHLFHLSLVFSSPSSLEYVIINPRHQVITLLDTSEYVSKKHGLFFFF